MFIDTEYTPELDQREISKFVFDKKRTELIGAVPNLQGYSLSKSRIAGKTQIDLWAQIKEYYNVIERNSILSSFSVIIPVGLISDIGISSNLFVKDGIGNDKLNKITKIFDEFDPNSGIDPNDYIYQQLQIQTEITSEMFSMRQSYTIVKRDVEFKEQRQEIDKMLAFYNGKDTQSKIDVLGSDITISGYFKKKGIRAELIKRENLEDFIFPAKNPIHTVEGTDPSEVDKIVIENAKGFDCGKIIVAKTRIATVFHVPQFKVESGLRKVRIGCFNITLPWIRAYVRDNLQVLYACVGHNENLQQHLVQQLISCSTNAALTSAVIGVITLNPAGALAAFQILLIKCLTAFGESEIACLFPDLVIQSEPQGWTLIEL